MSDRLVSCTSTPGTCLAVSMYRKSVYSVALPFGRTSSAAFELSNPVR